MKRLSTSALAVVFLLLALFAALPVQAATYTIGPQWGNPFPPGATNTYEYGGIYDMTTNTMNRDDTLWLTPGTYVDGSVTDGNNNTIQYKNAGIFIDKSMTIGSTSGDPADTIISGVGALASNFPLWGLRYGPTVTIKNLTFTGASSTGAHPNLALYDTVNLILDNCVFDAGNGIYVSDDASPISGGTGHTASLTVAGALTVSALSFVQSTGGTVSADIGELNVSGMDTALTVDGTAAGNVVIDTVSVAAGQTLTITSLNSGWLTINHLNIASGGAVTGDVDAVLPAVGLAASSLPGGTENSAYSRSIAADASGLGPFTFALAAASSLPAGLTISADGLISGTPTAAVASQSFDVTVTDVLGRTATETFKLAIKGLGGPMGAAIPALEPMALVLLALLVAGVAMMQRRMMSTRRA